MNSQALNKNHPIVLPKPNEGFEKRYYEILDNGWYELDRETKDARELMDQSILPVAVEEILKVGIDASATDWAEGIYFDLLSEKKCVYDDEFWDIVKRLPDFYAVAGSKQKMKDYLMGINWSTFLELIDGMPVYRLASPNPAIPSYHLKGKGYHPENTSDWLNFDKGALIKCEHVLSTATISSLNQKYLKPNSADSLIQELKKDIGQLKVKIAGNAPNRHLIIKYDIEHRSHLYDKLSIHVLEDLLDWVVFWTSRNYPLGLNIQFLVGG